VDPGLVFRNEWGVLGSRNVSVDELATVVDLTAAGKVQPVVVGIFGLEKVESCTSGCGRGRSSGATFSFHDSSEHTILPRP